MYLITNTTFMISRLKSTAMLNVRKTYLRNITWSYLQVRFLKKQAKPVSSQKISCGPGF